MSEPSSTETNEQLATAVGLYAIGDLTVGQAADRGGISRFEMYATLQASNVQLRVGAVDRDAAMNERDVARAIR